MASAQLFVSKCTRHYLCASLVYVLHIQHVLSQIQHSGIFFLSWSPSLYFNLLCWCIFFQPILSTQFQVNSNCRLCTMVVVLRILELHAVCIEIQGSLLLRVYELCRDQQDSLFKSDILHFSEACKVRIFWEGHKIWKNLPLKIWRYSVIGDFFKFCGLLRISKL